MLAGLSVWVARLVRTFQIEWTEIPPWWYRHEAFIHELLALRQAREQVAYDPAEAENAPLTWLHNPSVMGSSPIRPTDASSSVVSRPGATSPQRAAIGH